MGIIRFHRLAIEQSKKKRADFTKLPSALRRCPLAS